MGDLFKSSVDHVGLHKFVPRVGRVGLVASCESSKCDLLTGFVAGPTLIKRVWSRRTRRPHFEDDCSFGPKSSPLGSRFFAEANGVSLSIWF